jgi:hypothetical protein
MIANSGSTKQTLWRPGARSPYTPRVRCVTRRTRPRAVVEVQSGSEQSGNGILYGDASG